MRREEQKNNRTAAVPPSVRAVVEEPGVPLEAAARADLEPRYGHDFSRVRVHQDNTAAAAVREVGARAFTFREHVVFGPGAYRWDTGAGRALITHELAHVVQQSADTRGELRMHGRGTPAERMASLAASDVLAGHSARPGAVPAGVQRDEPVFVDFEAVSPERSEQLRRQGVNLPKASALGAPRDHSQFLDRRVTQVGFGIYLGGYVLYLADAEEPVFLPESFVDSRITAVRDHDSVVYPDRQAALRAIPVGPLPAGEPFPMTYFRGAAGLVVPAFVGPGSAPRTYETMVEARRELGRVVSEELLVVAASILGGMLVKGLIGRLSRPRSKPPKVTTRNAPKPGTGSGKGAPKPGKSLFEKPTVTPDPRLPAGHGETDALGNVRYSTQGSPKDVAMARYHESVHSALSPKFRYFRNFRANLGMSAYERSRFLKYLEEALAETYAQLRVNGIKGLPDGLQFPIKNGYVTLKDVVTEAALGMVAVGGSIYGVYLVVTDTDEPTPATEEDRP